MPRTATHTREQLSEAPNPGTIVTVRRRQWVVEEVRGSALPVQAVGPEPLQRLRTRSQNLLETQEKPAFQRAPSRGRWASRGTQHYRDGKRPTMSRCPIRGTTSRMPPAEEASTLYQAPPSQTLSTSR